MRSVLIAPIATIGAVVAAGAMFVGGRTTGGAPAAVSPAVQSKAQTAARTPACDPAGAPPACAQTARTTGTFIYVGRSTSPSPAKPAIASPSAVAPTRGGFGATDGALASSGGG